MQRVVSAGWLPLKVQQLCLGQKVICHTIASVEAETGTMEDADGASVSVFPTSCLAAVATWFGVELVCHGNTKCSEFEANRVWGNAFVQAGSPPRHILCMVAVYIMAFQGKQTPV